MNNDTPPDVEQRAEMFAFAAHTGKDHRRRYTLEPYINHPRNVVAIVKQVDPTPEMVAGAWLHDVVEDTAVTIDDIERFFGSKVRSIVAYVSDASKPEDGNREVRKAIDRAHIAAAPYEAQTVKLADLIDNAHDIQKNDPDFAVVYMREKRELLKVLTRGNRMLHAQATEIVANYFLTQEVS